MNISGNTVLITGGGSGIGLALAQRFLQADNKVIICGRREDKLKEAKQMFSKLHTRVCDVSKESDRHSLAQWVTAEFPELNMLVNNAGIQQRVSLLNATDEWSYYRQELTANLDAPLHLSMLLLPHLVEQEQANIINISSGLAMTPGAWVPIYSATKAALHSFTVSLRLQLAKTNVRVVEVFPPAVNTDLGGPGLHTFGAPLDDFADAVFQGFESGEPEIGYGGTEQRLQATRAENEESTQVMWEQFLNRTPSFHH